MNVKLLIHILCLATVAKSQTVNWCAATSNCAVNQHVACNNNGAFSSTCDTPKAYALTTAQKQQVLDLHNSNRNRVATGQLPPFLPAKRMAKVVWNDQLAYLAELNTKQCKMAHDACRNTPTFKYSGQNLAMMMTTGTYTVEAVVNGSLSMWFNEYPDANMDNINKYGTSSNGKVIGHFTALVTDRSTQIGCAMASFKQNGWNTFLFACNYASTNIINYPVYKSGAAASACTQGSDATYKGLCKTTEPIDPNAL